MTEEQGAISEEAIERGQVFRHETYGQVEVLGIWKGIRSVDEAGNLSDADGPIVICYSICEGDQPVGELSDTLESFRASIERTE